MEVLKFGGLIGCLALLGCPSLDPFGCVGAEQCDLLDAPGTCLADGDCAYEDGDCPSGLRRSANAQTDPGECVSDIPEGTTTETGTATSGTTTTATLTSSTTGQTDPTTASESCGLMAWYPDADADGFGDANAEPIMACDQPEGSLPTAEDCNDADPRVRPDHLDCENNPTLAAWYRFDDPVGQGFLLDSGREGLPGDVDDATLGEPGQYGTAVRLQNDEELTFREAIAAYAPEGVPPTEGTIEFWARVDPLDEECEDGCARFAVQISDEVGDGFGGNTPDLHIHAAHDGANTPYFWYGLIDTTEGEPEDPDYLQSSCSTRGPDVEFERWTHVALRWNTEECTLLIDGLVVDSDAMGIINEGWSVGRLGRPPDYVARSFLGAIDELMIFDEARTDVQIRADCGSLPCPPA